MDISSSVSKEATGWEQEIRACEEDARAAFLNADLSRLDKLWTDSYAVNSPIEQVLDKKRVLELLQSGRIRHTTYEFEIEFMSRHGDVVVVMGRDRVADAPDGKITRRRYTNIWQLDEGVWRSIARHAHVVSRDTAG